MSQGVTIKGKTVDDRSVPVRVTNDGLLSVEDSPLAVRIDDTTTAGFTYIGKAPIGTLPSAPGWQIQRLATSSGLVKSWADGNADFDNVWDNRATTITYA